MMNNDENEGNMNDAGQIDLNEVDENSETYQDENELIVEEVSFDDLIQDDGEDKMERMAAQKAQSIWDIARHYTEAYWADIKALNKGHIADVAAHHNTGDCSKACAESDRHIEEHQTNHDKKRYQSDHAVSPSFSASGSFFSRSIRFSSARSTNNAPMIGRTR